MGFSPNNHSRHPLVVRLLLLTAVASMYVAHVTLVVLPPMMWNGDHGGDRERTTRWQPLPGVDRWCESLRRATAPGPYGRTLVHAFVSNSGHLPFLRNALLSVRRAGLPWRPLVLALGGGVCPALEEEERDQSLSRDDFVCLPYLDRLVDQLARDEPESMEQIRPYLVTPTAAKGSNSRNSSSTGNAAKFGTIDNTFYGWGSVEHKFLINAKLYALRDILRCGVDAFLTDTDVAFRGDPRPHFAVPGPRGDVVAQNDTNDNYELSLNSGFMHWRHTPDTLDLIEDIITVPPFWHVDQARVNARMHNRTTPHTLLDARAFPNGWMFLHHFDALRDDIIVAFHANFNDKKSQKVEMLEKMGLWYVSTNDTTTPGASAGTRDKFEEKSLKRRQRR